MKHLKEALRVKVKTLAEEARIIRHEVNRLKGFSYKTQDSIERTLSLNGHRTGIVRYEARHAQLAAAYLRGAPYEAAERFAEDPPNPVKIFDNVCKFANIRDPQRKAALAQEISKWLGYNHLVGGLCKYALA